MPEIGTSGSMSGDGKRDMAQSGLDYRAHPRLYPPSSLRHHPISAIARLPIPINTSSSTLPYSARPVVWLAAILCCASLECGRSRKDSWLFQ